jgi:hypothetical protein
MTDFRVVHVSFNGLALLSCEDNRPVRSRLMLYRGRLPAAEVVDTISLVDRPLYLAKPLLPLEKKDVLSPKR